MAAGFDGPAARQPVTGRGATIKQARVTVEGFTQDYTFDTSGQTREALNWQPTTFTFVATGKTATLTFTSLSAAGSAYGALIDNVTIVQKRGRQR